MNFQVEWFEKLASTNATLREKITSGSRVSSGQIIAAHEQTAGRGRQDRKWLTAPNQNLCFSLFVQTNAELIAVPSLTMAASLAVTEMLRSKRINAMPKWPNDVLVGDKKICGILSERMEQSSPSKSGIIIGIGLNINMTSDEADRIDRPATSMLIESNQANDISQILSDLFQPLEYWINKWEAGGFTALREIWSQQAGPLGKTLTVHDGDIKKTGTLAGFGNHGELLLQTNNGLETIWSGDVITGHRPTRINTE